MTRASSVASAEAESCSNRGNTTLALAGVVAVGAVTATHAAGDATVRVLGSAILGSLLALVGYKKKSLDASGALAAIGVGFGSIYADARFGAALASFFFTSVPRDAIKGMVDLSDDPNAPTDVFK